MINLRMWCSQCQESTPGAACSLCTEALTACAKCGRCFKCGYNPKDED